MLFLIFWPTPGARARSCNIAPAVEAVQRAFEGRSILLPIDRNRVRVDPAVAWGDGGIRYLSTSPIWRVCGGADMAIRAV